MSLLIRNARCLIENDLVETDVRVSAARISAIGNDLVAKRSDRIIDAKGRLLMPGVIDDQVHFREPGLTQKGDLTTESRACLAGGITSYMEMPNTKPTTTTHAELAAKLARGREVSRANYAFYFGASNDNLEAVRSIDPASVAGVKVFMGASTGSMLVDDPVTLEGIFREAPCLIATHCEHTPTINANLAAAKARYGDNIPLSEHPHIRSVEACYRSTELAVALAKKFDSRLHVLHLTSARELAFFAPGPSDNKRITVETCVHFLHFDETDYARFGNLIKCNPAIKSSSDRVALIAAVADGRIDVLATDHAPHLLEEKSQDYERAPGGLPLVQFALQCSLERYFDGTLPLITVLKKWTQIPATIFNVRDRGFIREGYFADLTLVDLNKPQRVTRDQVLSKCGWSPFENTSFKSSIAMTILNGQVVYEDGLVNDSARGMALEFVR
jgi:dihydroorotase